MLKRIMLLCSLVILMIILSVSKTKTEIVYKEITNDNEYKEIYLFFENDILNTNNFEEYLKRVKIIKIYPYINPIYENKIKPNYSYSFNYKNHSYNLEKFKNDYIKKLTTIGLMNEVNEIQIKGITIKKVLVYSNLEELNELIKNKNIKYEIKNNKQL